MRRAGIKYTSELGLEASNLYEELGSYTLAGEKLGVSRDTIRRWIDRYHRDPDVAEWVAAARNLGLDYREIPHFWTMTQNPDGTNFSFFTKTQNKLTFEQMKDILVEDLQNFTPTSDSWPSISPFQQQLGNHLLVIDPADIHVGKLSLEDETGNEYNIKIATERVIEGIRKLMVQSKGYPLEAILLVIGNDILHIDNPKRTTTAGTSQDTDGMWWSAYLAAKNLYVTIIQELMLYAPVHLVYCPSNHDYQSGFHLADVIYSWFKNCPLVTFEERHRSIRHRKYFLYGTNLIGLTHGDGAKVKDLNSIMTLEAKEEWGVASHPYWYIHHYHHKIRKLDDYQIEKDDVGVTVIGNRPAMGGSKMEIEYVRSPSPPDAWHDRNGYLNKQALEAFIHHPDDGQVARLTTYF